MVLSPSLLERFRDKKILVIGDMVADQFISGSPARISREAPVLILEHEKTEIVPGGAANTINNIVDLGAKAYAVGLIGSDQVGKILADTLAVKGVCTEGLIVDKQRPTITKSRIWAGEAGAVKQQVVRIDSGVKDDISDEMADRVFGYVQDMLGSMDAVLFSDYGYGLFPEQLVAQLVNAASAAQIVSAADSRYHLPRFAGVTVATPNKPEAEALTGKKLIHDCDAEAMAETVRALLRLQAAIITRGEEGMSIAEADGGVCHIPAFNKTEVYDVTGAGDTVIAALTVALAAGASILDSALLANIAASIVIRRVGTATVRLEELTEAVAEYEHQLQVSTT